MKSQNLNFQKNCVYLTINYVDSGLLMGASIWVTKNLPGIVISKRFIKKTTPHLYKKWGLDNQSMGTSRLFLWVSFYITLLNYNRTNCNKIPLEFVTKGLRRLGDEKII